MLKTFLTEFDKLTWKNIPRLARVTLGGGIVWVILTLLDIKIHTKAYVIKSMVLACEWANRPMEDHRTARNRSRYTEKLSI